MAKSLCGYNPRRLMLKSVVLAAAILAAACALAPPPACQMPELDRAWLNRAIEAWRFSCREITGITSVPNFQAIFFSADCVLTSSNALSSASPREVMWSARRHAGKIILPDGGEIPAGVTSFTSGKNGTLYFVMSTPSVWAAAGVGKGADLERTMVAVLLHEASHVAQIGPYGKRLGALIDRNKLPDSFNDDSLQERFEKNTDIAGSVKHETELFLQAAAAPDNADAKRLAHEARELMHARQAKWFAGEDAFWSEAEDIWLTFEGAGQWVAFQWMIHPGGAAVPHGEALQRFSRGHWWSQTEGFAVVMALDRLAGPAWKRHAFGDGAQTVLEMIDDAIR
jgi:hypothetical protein